MKKKKPNLILFFLLIGALLVLGSASTVFATGEAGADMIKEYKFEAKSAQDLKYNVPEKMKDGGKTYKLIGVDYDIIKDNVVKITQNVTTDDITQYQKTIEHQLPSGKTIILTAAGKIDWQERLADGVTKIQEYTSRNRIPQSIAGTKTGANGEPIDITLELAGTENISRTETFFAPAVFYSPSATGTRYSFNGKVVTITGDSPTWSGYENDVKAYLGLNGSSYQVTGGSWTDNFTAEGNRYVRHATYTGTRTTPLYRATFTETEDTRSQYTATITYRGVNPDQMVKAKAIASYERILGIRETILIGAGVLVLILAVIAVLFVVRRHKKKSRKEESKCAKL